MTSAAGWQPASGMALEPNADVAVREVDRSVALTAGPGAGKTELLAQRADFLFRTGACSYPKRILAISFKVDAARNLRERVARRCGVKYASRFDSRTFHAFAKQLIDRYRPVLTGMDALDPDYTVGSQRAQRTIITYHDFVPLAITIATSSDIARNAIRQTYSHVFLDEFQDCTQEQYQLVQALFVDTPALLTAVGDTKQRIMAWAGALEGIFLEFQSDFDALALNLYQNFRSEPTLRRMQNRMIAVMEPAAAMDPADIPGEDGTIDVLHFADGAEEAEHVSILIHELLDEGVPPNEIAVLAAKQPNLIAATLIERLTANGIPVRNEQDLQDLTAEPISEIILDVLRVVIDSRQPAAYHRLMALAERSGVDDGSADRLRLRIDRCITTVRSQHSAAMIDLADTGALRDVIDDFRKVIGYEAIAALSHDYNDQRHLNERIDTLLERFAAEIGNGIDPVAALDMLSGEEAISLLTIHKSKGLEFDTVILLGVEHETFWSDLDQERCVFFVGISRAKSRLVLTTASRRPSPPGAPRSWNVQRRPHAEFLGYVAE